MRNDLPAFDPCRIWQEQETETMTLTLDDIRRKALAFERTIRRRNRREYLGGLVAIAASVAQGATMHDPLARLSFLLMAAGVAFVLWRLWSHGSAAPVPADLGRASCLAFHRRELERQRDLLRGVWLWYVAPPVPGIALLTADAFYKGQGGRNWIAPVVAAAVGAGFWFIVKLNGWAADRLDRQVQEIERWENQDV
jgi:hypothetical protein